MRKSLVLGAVAAASLAGVVVPGTAGATQGSHITSGSTNSRLHARYTAIPYQGSKARLQRATTSVPTFAHTLVSGGRSFTYRQVGKDPFVKQSVPTSTVPVKVIPIRVIMQSFGNKTFDP